MSPQKVWFLSLVLVSSLVVGACAPRMDLRGKLLDEDDIQKLKINIHSKHDVRNLFGEPTVINTYLPDQWLYIYRKTLTKAFLTPKTTEYQVTVLNFNKAGVLQSINNKGVKDLKEVQHVSRTTPTTGHDIGVLQQVFGNFGRIHRQTLPK